MVSMEQARGLTNRAQMHRVNVMREKMRDKKIRAKLHETILAVEKRNAEDGYSPDYVPSPLEKREELVEKIMANRGPSYQYAVEAAARQEREDR
jgi:hypothetical protein